jgi:hypothetical protein
MRPTDIMSRVTMPIRAMTGCMTSPQFLIERELKRVLNDYPVTKVHFRDAGQLGFCIFRTQAAGAYLVVFCMVERVQEIRDLGWLTMDVAFIHASRNIIRKALVEIQNISLRDFYSLPEQSVPFSQKRMLSLKSASWLLL